MPAPRFLTIAGALLAGFLHAPLAGAMVLDCGPTICFQYQESQAAVALFGLPVRVGDSLQFLPPAALALSADGAGETSLAATFVIDRVFSGTGALSSIRVVAEGDYDAELAGTVAARIDLQISNNLGPGAATTSDLFSATGTGGAPGIWALNATIHPSEHFPAYSSDLRIDLSQSVSALTVSGGEHAWTEAKYISVTATAVPAPPALGLLATGFLAAALRARRR
jgi:hypothetical protein